VASFTAHTLSIQYHPELSAGNSKKALVAQTLAGSPELLVLDEPLLNLDSASRITISSELTPRANPANEDTVSGETLSSCLVSGRILLVVRSFSTSSRPRRGPLSRWPQPQLSPFSLSPQSSLHPPPCTPCDPC
jgi:hypothetical protein